jgi:hypothetical protein
MKGYQFHLIGKSCAAGLLLSNILLISSEAIKTVSANIVNIVNNHRTGELVLTFLTKRHFIGFTYVHHTYPLNKATDNALITSYSSRWVARSIRRQQRKISRSILLTTTSLVFCCTNNIQASDYRLRSATLFCPKVLDKNIQRGNCTSTSTDNYFNS